MNDSQRKGVFINSFGTDKSVPSNDNKELEGNKDTFLAQHQLKLKALKQKIAQLEKEIEQKLASEK